MTPRRYCPSDARVVLRAAARAAGMVVLAYTSIVFLIVALRALAVLG